MIHLMIGRCRIEISFWFAAVCAFMLLLNEGAQVTLLATLFHESGHIAVMCLLGQIPQKIAFHAFGIDVGERGMDSYKRDMAVSLAGPFINLITGLIMYQSWPVFSHISLFLGAFHLLPILYLDGGRAFYSLLCMKWESHKAEKAILWISVLTLLPVGVVAFLILLDSKGNFSLLLLWVYLMAMLSLKSRHFF